EQAAERLRQFAQFGKRSLQFGVSGDADFDGVVSRGEAGIADLGLAQGAANVVAHLVELFFPDVIGIHFQKQVGAALQIEPEDETPLGPGRPILYFRLRKEVRHCEQTHGQRRENDRQRLPPREIQHRIDSSDPGECGAGYQPADVSSLEVSLAGSPLARTPEITCRIWRTRTPSEISNSI